MDYYIPILLFYLFVIGYLFRFIIKRTNYIYDYSYNNNNNINNINNNDVLSMV